MKEEKKFLTPTANIIYFEGDEIDCLVLSGEDELGGISYDELE